MIIEKSLDGFRATVPCKVNLFLEVLGKRDDGYHSLDTVMMAVSLVDELEITVRHDDLIELAIEFPEGYGQPIDREDFAWDIPANQSKPDCTRFGATKGNPRSFWRWSQCKAQEAHPCDGRIGRRKR